MFVLDTNAVVHALKGLGRVRDMIARIHPSDLAIPAVVAYELELGVLGSRNPAARRRDLMLVLRTLPVLPFDSESASSAARVRFELERAGETIGPIDTLIAGTVLAQGPNATLITHNSREFSRVQSLRIDDWF